MHIPAFNLPWNEGTELSMALLLPENAPAIWFYYSNSPEGKLHRP